MTAAEQTTTSLRRRTVLAAVASALAFAGGAHAQPAFDLVDLQVVDRETGDTAQVWRHAGRLFVAGRPGARYSLRVTNNTGGRVLVVMSVDGVNILTGETAAFGQRGYVFKPYESYDVSGWRKSDTEIAAFTFAPLSRSYAAQTGRPDDVGVVGIAAFRERTPPPPPPPPAVSPLDIPDARANRDSSSTRQALGSSGAFLAPAPAAPSARAAPPPPPRPSPSGEVPRRAEKLGTGHGAREWSAVTTVPFERATAYPQLIQRIEYDSQENLIAAGVIPGPRPRPTPPRPRPFPASPGAGYVPDPPYGR